MERKKRSAIKNKKKSRKFILAKEVEIYENCV